MLRSDARRPGVGDADIAAERVGPRAKGDAQCGVRYERADCRGVVRKAALEGQLNIGAGGEVDARECARSLNVVAK